jgi:hypothetical protein
MVFVIAILLFGALLATIAFVVIDRGSTQKQVSDLAVANEALTKDNGTLKNENDTLKAAFGPYQAMAGREGMLADGRRRLNERLSDNAYATIKGRLTPGDNALLGGASPWPAGAWSDNTWKGMVVDNLNKQLDGIVALQQRIDTAAASAGIPVQPGASCDPRDANCR